MDCDRHVINNLRFSQDHDCFLCSLETGLKIFNVDPLLEKSHYDISYFGSVSKCEILTNSNLLAIVSGGSRPKYSDNILLIFDNAERKTVLEITFPSSIRAIRARKDKLAVALLKEIHIYSYLVPTQKLYSINTIPNPRGLLELSSSESCEREILIFPGYKTGTVEILDLSCIEISMSRPPVRLNAHLGELACLALNPQATKLATASVQGTLIRIWDVTTRQQLLELRRGTDPASIYCLNFSRNSDYLCCSSDKGTIHIFALKNTELNKRMLISKTRILGGYCDSQWAFATFTVPPEKPCICAFTLNNSVIVACLDGTFRRYIFNYDGNCYRDAFDVFVNVEDDGDDAYWL